MAVIPRMSQAAGFCVTTILLAVSACAPAPSPDAACAVYAARRVEMPRPLPDDALGRWTAITDAGLTGACR